MKNLKYLSLICLLAFFSCKNSTNKTTVKNEEKSDSLISDVQWSSEENESESYVEEEEVVDEKVRKPKRSGARGGASDNDEYVVKYKNYTRDGSSDQDFANSIIYHAIRMVYSDNFAKPKAEILNSSNTDDKINLDIKISWKDHWVSNFEITGNLQCNNDGSNATFTINSKNEYAEALEFTEDNFKSEITLSSI